MMLCIWRELGMETHTTSIEPQPIADQWMAKCSCGWRKSFSTYEFDDPRAEAELEAEVHEFAHMPVL